MTNMLEPADEVARDDDGYDVRGELRRRRQQPELHDGPEPRAALGRRRVQVPAAVPRF